MIVRHYSAETIKKISLEKELILFGAGRNLNHLFEWNREFKFEETVKLIVDNSREKWGQDYRVNGNKIPIQSPETLNQFMPENLLIVITVADYQPIFAQLQNLFWKDDVCITTFPEDKWETEKELKKKIRERPLREDWIILRGEGDTCENAVVFSKTLKKSPREYTLIWLCDHPEKFEDSKKNIHIRWGVLHSCYSREERNKFIYYMFQAKYLFFDNMFINKVREDQVSVYLKHGEMPIKSTIGLINLPKNLNYTTASSVYSRRVITRQYSVNPERVILCGQPRTDILFSKKEDNEAEKFLNIRNFSKTILWMPTFRQHISGTRNDSGKNFYKGIPILDNDREIQDLENKLTRSNIQLVIKPHKYQDLRKIQFHLSRNLRVITQDDIDQAGLNTHRLMRYVDAMITDYSSVEFDFMLLDRPMGFTLDDINDYKLDFAVSNPQMLMPGKHIFNIEDLMDFIDDINKGKDRYKEERRLLNKKVNQYVNGHSSQRLCQLLHL